MSPSRRRTLAAALVLAVAGGSTGAFVAAAGAHSAAPAVRRCRAVRITEHRTPPLDRRLTRGHVAVRLARTLTVSRVAARHARLVRVVILRAVRHGSHLVVRGRRIAYRRVVTVTVPRGRTRHARVTRAPTRC